MKKNILTTALLAMSVTAFAALPKHLASITEVENNIKYPSTFSYDISGRLNRIVDDTSVISIDYSNIANGKITLKNTEGAQVSTFEITLNEQGLATSVVENDYEGDTANWEFTYTDNRLTKITIRNGSETEYVYITWEDGLISSYVQTESYDNETSTASFSYAGVVNVGSVALYDEIYNIDLDELEYIAMAGYMGETPRELPTGATFRDGADTENITIDWERDAEGYPIKMSSPQSRNSHTLFVWEADNSDVKSMTVDDNETSTFYTIDGVRSVNPNTGIVIERKSDGSTVKHIIKR